MLQLPPRSRDRTYLRDKLILKLVEDGEDHLPSIVELAEAPMHTVKFVIKSNKTKAQRDVRHHMHFQRITKRQNLVKGVKAIIERKDRKITIPMIKLELERKLMIKTCLSKISQVLKFLGYRFRRIRPIQSYVNSKVNIEKRAIHGRQLTQLLEFGFKVVSVDECMVNESSNANYSWFLIGVDEKSMWKQPHEPVTVIAATLPTGEILYSLLKGSNNQATYA